MSTLGIAYSSGAILILYFWMTQMRTPYSVSSRVATPMSCKKLSRLRAPGARLAHHIPHYPPKEVSNLRRRDDQKSIVSFPFKYRYFRVIHSYHLLDVQNMVYLESY